MNQEIRNKLRNVVTHCRKLLEDSVSQELEGKYGIFAKKDQVTADPNAKMPHLAEEEQVARKDILDHFGHIKARGFKPKEALDQLVREIAFTHLNRLCAYKMMEAREVYVGGQKFREAVSRGVNSNGVKFYLAANPEEERLFNTGHQDVAYRHFLDWLGGLLSEEIGVLFNPNDPANRLYPRQKTLDEVLDLLNGGGIKPEETELREEWPKIWSQDETIGWVYQYFTPKELRDQSRKESATPRNSYELAFRNQFFTPRYVVEFLTDNTLGRIWFEMRKGDTKLKDQCQYMVRRPIEHFLKDGEQPPKDAAEGRDDLSQEELLKLPVYIPHRPKKDPRELRILDPASGSGHFLLYCFDLLLTIYDEAYGDTELGPALQKDYAKLEDLRRDVPRLILFHNVHGIDIDLRASQIAALALWLRCQRAYQEMGLKKDRPQIKRSNFICAEPMPGEEQIFKEFVDQKFATGPEEKLLGRLVKVVFDKMKQAGEAGPLLKIEEEIREVVADARKQWVRESTLAVDRKGRTLLFSEAEMDRVKAGPVQSFLFSVSEISEANFFQRAEHEIVNALHGYAEQAQNGQRLQRRLFTDDAERGFAFVDLCHKRYDVVLMNPPFGTASLGSADYIGSKYPTWNKNVLCAFIERGLAFLSPLGALGAIFDRTAAIKSTYEDFRRAVFFASDRPRYCGDLGWEVLDANVETSTMIWHSQKVMPCDAHFYDVRSVAAEDKGSVLHDLVRHPSSPSFTIVPVEAFFSLPNAAMGYDMPRFFIALASHRRSLGDSGMQAYTGAQMRAEQHFRVFWECGLDQHFTPESSYCYMYNGGEYSRYFLPPRDVALYGHNGEYVNEQDDTYSWRIQSKHAYFKSGVGFGKLGEFLDAHYLRKGYLFTVEGQSIPLVSEHRKLVLLGLLNSTAFQIAINSYCGQHKYSGYLNLFPCPDTDEPVTKAIAATVLKAVSECEQWFAHEQTCLLFCGVPWLLVSQKHNIGSSYESYLESWRKHQSLLNEYFIKIDEMICQLLHVVEEAELKQIDALRARLTEPHDSPYSASEYVSDSVDYCVSVALGRWDVRLAAQDALKKQIDAAPDAYPSSPLGQLPGTDAFSVDKSTPNYPIQIIESGIVVDDPQHPDDLVRRVKAVLEVLWKDLAEGVEKDGCEILGVRELRDYFRKPGKGGFWDDHVTRYSKGRRKAPIYWLLQSSKKNYAIWLYYHRLDKDLLFKVLVNYIEPKIRFETSRLETLRKEKPAAGESAKDAKRLAKEVERQEDFISELRDFEDKLRRAANLHLEPDLNDGVVLNIAPLHELVPWKEAENYWGELLAGKYEWSSIGKQLRQKGLVK